MKRSTINKVNQGMKGQLSPAMEMIVVPEDESSSEQQSENESEQGTESSSREKDVSDESVEGSSYDEFNREYFTQMYEQEKMIADQERMDFYYQLIKQHIKPGMRVLDLGTGTGILAAWAAQCGADVLAIDHSPVMLQRAEQLIKANGIKGVTLQCVHSSEVKVKKSERFDVILHEQIGDILFDEYMVPNVLDARNRLLKPGGLILPSQFQLFVQPVEIDRARNVPFISEHTNIHGIDFSGLGNLQPSREEEPGYYHFRSSDASLIDKYLCEEEPVLTVDLLTLLHEGGLQKKLKFAREVLSNGRLDGFAVYFKVFSGVPGAAKSLQLCSGPLAQLRAVHWGYRVLRLPAMQLAAKETINVLLRVGSWEDLNSWTWSCKLQCSTTATISTAAGEKKGSLKKARTEEPPAKKKKKGLSEQGNIASGTLEGGGGTVEFMSIADIIKLQQQQQHGSSSGGKSHHIQKTK